MKSKCSNFECCCIKIQRDILAENQIEIERIEHNIKSSSDININNILSNVKNKNDINK